MTGIASPGLRLRLPGRWHSIGLRSEQAVESSARRVAARLVGTGDDRAMARIRIREQIRRGVVEGRPGGLRSVLIASEPMRGVALPATISVFEPPGLRILPSIGTDPESVAKALRRVLIDLEVDGIGEAEELDLGAFRALRIRRVEARTRSSFRPDDADAGYSAEKVAEAERSVGRQLIVQYWCTVPDSKDVVLVVCTTPLGDIARSMVRFFDSIIRAARYAPVEHPDAAATLIG